MFLLSFAELPPLGGPEVRPARELGLAARVLSVLVRPADVVEDRQLAPERVADARELVKLGFSM